MTRAMPAYSPEFQVRIAESSDDRRAAQRLRYRVFSEEMGANGPSVDHRLGLDEDEYDALADHLLLIDPKQSWNHGVIGTYRMLPQARLGAEGRFYSASEFDLDPLLGSGRSLLELGRSCLLPQYRGTTPALFEMWAGIAAFVIAREVEVLFGVASFPGTDAQALATPLSYLHHSHLAPEALRVSAQGPQARAMDLLPPEAVDRRAAVLALPPLIKAYLRVGGVVGQGAWVDEGFNTVDVCMILDVARMPAQSRALYTGGIAG